MESLKLNIKTFVDEGDEYVETVPHPRLLLVGVKHAQSLLPYHLEHLGRLKDENIELLLLEAGDYFEILEGYLVRELGVMKKAVNIDRGVKYTEITEGLLQATGISDRSFIIELIAFLLPLTVFPADVFMSKKAADWVFFLHSCLTTTYCIAKRSDS